MEEQNSAGEAVHDLQVVEILLLEYDLVREIGQKKGDGCVISVGSTETKRVGDETERREKTQVRKKELSVLQCCVGSEP